MNTHRSPATSSSTPHELEHFHYSPLPNSTSIRLLSFVDPSERIDTSPSDGHALLECHVDVVDLADNPEYKALSYTWGSLESGAQDRDDVHDATPRIPIILNRNLFHVTTNLYDALWQLGPYAQHRTLAHQQFQSYDQEYIDFRWERYNKTALIQAAEDGNLSLLNWLLERGASVHSYDCFGETALHYAAANGHPPIVEQLLKYNASRTKCDDEGRTPLDCCLEYKRRQYIEVASLLQNDTTDPRFLNSSVQSGQDIQPVMNTRAARASKPSIKDRLVICSKIWIDAICIDQNNNEERAVQVAMMNRIFSNAQSVLVWLGPSDETTQMVWDFLLSQKTMSLTETTAPIGTALDNFFERPWFKRKWIIQEMALAREFEIFCGPFQFDWELIARLVISTSTETYKFSMPRNWAWFEAYVLVILRYAAVSKSISYYGLPALLGITRSFQTSEPRDQIYSLLGIANIPSESSLVPDYTCSTSYLCTRASRLFIEAQGNNQISHPADAGFWGVEPLEGLSFVQRVVDRACNHDPLLCHCHPMSPAKGSPSWIFETWQSPSRERIFNLRFSASKCVAPKLYPSPDEILRLDAHLIDFVVEVQENEASTDLESHSGNPDSWLEIVEKLKESSELQHNRMEMLWWTLIVDDTEDPDFTRSTFRSFVYENIHRRSSSLGSQARMRLMSELSALEEMNGFHHITDPNKPHESSNTGVADQDSHDMPPRNVYSFHCKYAENGAGRGLLRTKTGFLGLGPEWTKPGDEVWLLAGTRVPYILRPLTNTSSGHYQLVGEAYIHGIMYGELFDQRVIDFHPIDIH